MSSGWRNSQVSFQPDCLLFFNYRRSSAAVSLSRLFLLFHFISSSISFCRIDALLYTMAVCLSLCVISLNTLFTYCLLILSSSLLGIERKAHHHDDWGERSALLSTVHRWLKRPQLVLFSTVHSTTSLHFLFPFSLPCALLSLVVSLAISNVDVDYYTDV